MAQDDYGFSFDPSFQSEYLSFHNRYLERKAAIALQKINITPTTTSKKLKQYVANGVLNEQRPLVSISIYRNIQLIRSKMWMMTSGALKKKESANSNCESSTYYQEILEKNNKSIERGKPLESFHEVEKDITRTFPGHPVYETQEGLDKLKRVLQAYARRNKQVGYCQSMNFIAAFALLFLDEEDAFWLLATIVEDLCAGIWSRTMMNIQVDALVLAELTKEKLPELNKHFEKIHMSLLLLVTKWFMCVFVGILPTESTLRVWDFFLAQGSAFLFRMSLAILSHVQQDVLKAKDPMQCVKIVQQKSKTMFDVKGPIKIALKWEDVNKDKVEELRYKHRAALSSSEITSEQIEALREQVKGGWTGSAASSVVSSLSTTYKGISGGISSWYRGRKENYNNYLAKQQVAAAKSRNANVFEMDAATQTLLMDFAVQSNKPIDFVVEGIGVRLYSNGSKYQGHFANNKREGYGILYYANGKTEYDGFWKMDKKWGEGTHTNEDASVVYKGQWKADEYHGAGHLVSPMEEYMGEWRHNKRDGRGCTTIPGADAGKYDGEWKDDLADGKGTMLFNNGDRYDGDWKAGAQEGRGIMVYKNGDRYDGQWRDGLRVGKGSFYSAEGEKYEGEWKRDKMEGKGSKTYLNGDRYEGEWKNDKREGWGSAVFSDGSSFEGEWKNNRQNGRGTAVYAQQGTRYEGEWSGGKKQGHGKMFFPNGDVYEGEWRSDEREGPGIMTAAGPNAMRTSVTFEKGRDYILENGIKKEPYRSDFDVEADKDKRLRRLSLGAEVVAERTRQSQGLSASLSSSSYAAAKEDEAAKSTDESVRVGAGKYMGNRHMSAIEQIRRKNMAASKKDINSEDI
ncbi:hypothetical protein PROFUN_05374 [Planoprotostelium fungivorum]|uniref:Rab-GAP TBC domain-containing protein n=1 Tax=Planoprotostelium fungivorum TaxID=1890364 RepID=A0A2P6NR72_9EUKA|nr:hypothetical protein PROFUN_05374 [Planoprotostelium fungivorum]